METFSPSVAAGEQTQRCMFCSTYISLESHGYSRDINPSFDPCCDKAREVFPNHTVTDVLAGEAKFLDASTTLGATWYHITNRKNWIEDLTDGEDEWFVPLVHLGTELAAADRMKFYRWSPVAYMYKVRLMEDSVLNPDIFVDEDEWPETPDDLWDGTEVFRYVNSYEAVGSISLLVNPLKIVVEEVKVFEGKDIQEYLDRMDPRS